MEKRKLGKTELEITPVTFGAWAIGGWMWGGADKKDAIDALHTSLDIGISTIDTAPVYGFGRSEEIVGEAIKGKPRDKIEILTKYGLRWENDKGEFFFESKDNNGNPIKIYKYASADSIVQECEESLQRLGTDYIDLYQIHWNDPTTPIDESMKAVDKLLKDGKIRYAGVCNYNVDQMAQANSNIPLASNQVPYSMVLRDIEKNVVPWCLNNEVGILAYSPLQRGVLTGKLKPGHKFNEGDHRAGMSFYKPENIQRINNFLENTNPIKEKYNITNAQLVLNWTLQQPGITSVLAGARNAQQVKDNAGAAEFMLSKEEIEQINRELEKLTIVE